MTESHDFVSFHVFFASRKALRAHRALEFSLFLSLLHLHVPKEEKEEHLFLGYVPFSITILFALVIIVNMEKFI